MNILPKKSWHVRNKDNVEKVRKDEENAKKLEKERLQKVALAEQEARTDLLRKKARNALQANADSLANVQSLSRTPVNLFQDVGPDGKAINLSAKNAEHEEEKRLEKEKEEKKIGLLTYLGQSAVEALPDEHKPWYFKPTRPKNEFKNKKITVEEVKDVKRKATLDPLADINKHLSKKRKHKHKKKNKSKTFGDKSHQQLSSDDKLAKLRKARLEREAREKQRSFNLLQQHYNIEKPVEPTTSTFSQKYSNQFNPRFARNNWDK